MISLPKTSPASYPPGVVLYQGASLLDDGPIVVVATFESDNSKTGPMIQTWILRADVNPTTALHNGLSVSVCGNCPLNGRIVPITRMGPPLGISEAVSTVCVDRACYVQPAQAPHRVYYSWRNGNYPVYDPATNAHLFCGRSIRLGSYGDPIAVPVRVFRPILRIVKGWTGYTHQWKRRGAHRWADILHASTHTTEETRQAVALGWRVFQTATTLPSGMSWCPSTRGIQCNQCLGCRGTTGPSRAIRPHGAPTTRTNFARLQLV